MSAQPLAPGEEGGEAGGGLLDDDSLQEIYVEVVRARRVSEKMVNLQRQGRIGTFSQIDGQEIATVAAMWALDPDADWIVPAYREVRALKRFPSARILPVAVALATQIPQAVGLAWGERLQGRGSATLVFFGDGATSEGDFYEGLNFAGVVKAPVIFMCINNHWAISTPRSLQTNAESIAQKAEAVGIDGVQIDGNDVEAVFRATATARTKALAGEGPTLIEAITYRLGGHTTADDPSRYVPSEELAWWQEREPVGRLRAILEARGIFDPQLDERGATLAEMDVEAAIAGAGISKDPVTLFDHVYATPTTRMVEQREQLRALLDQRSGG